MRVLHVITGLSAGGAEQQLRLLLRHHTTDSEVVTLTPGGAVAAGIRADGRAVHELAMRGNRDLRALAPLVRLLRRGRFDLVHTHLYRACVYGRLAARIAGVPCLATEHSLGDRLIEGRRKSAAVRGLYLATERLGRATIAVSRAVVDRLHGWGVAPARVRYIPNGIAAESMRFQPSHRQQVRARYGIPPDAFVVAAVGRLVATKRFEVVVRAIAGLAGVWLLVVGDGAARESLARLVGQAGLADRVIFAGECRDIAGMLSAADVLAAPSPEETFGLTILEALAAGLPVLYSACPALADLPAAAAPGARWLPSDPMAYRAALTGYQECAGNRLPPPPAVAHYDIARGAAQVEALYQTLCRHRRPADSSHRQEQGQPHGG